MNTEPINKDDDCEQCSHPFNPHILIAVRESLVQGIMIPVGGYMVCPESECECYSTWSLPEDVVGYNVKATLAASSASEVKEMLD